MNYQNREDKILLAFISKPESHILDIGCGLGRYLIPLTKANHFVLGIDKNSDILPLCAQRKRLLACISAPIPTYKMSIFLKKL